MKLKPQFSLVRANYGRFPPGQVPFVGGTAPGEWRRQTPLSSHKLSLKFIDTFLNQE
jgi:hypothetical protein